MSTAAKDNKKIAIVVPTHWEFLMGGAQLQAKMLLEELTTRPGVEVNYFASRINPKTDTHGKYSLTKVAEPGRLHRYGLFWDYFSLQRRLADYQPDVIYQRVATAYTGICARYSKRHSIPMIWHVANSTDCNINKFDKASLRRPHAYLERALIQYGLKNADQIVVQNDDQRSQLERNFGKFNTHLIPNFHPVPDAPEKPDPAPLKLIWIANLKDSKRPEAMVDVARRLAHLPGIDITMVGTPYPELERAKQQAFEKSIDELPNIRYTGALPIESVNELLETSHLLVNTSIREGFSNTFIQAWLRCVPVLTLGVNPDNRLDGGALGAAFGSVENLSAAIIERSKNQPRLKADGYAARRAAERGFSLDNAKKLANLVLSTTAHQPTAQP